MKNAGAFELPMQSGTWLAKWVILRHDQSDRLVKKKGPKSGLCVHFFDTSTKLSPQVVLLVTLNFRYSASADLTFGDLYNHFCVENLTFLSLYPWGH